MKRILRTAAPLRNPPPRRMAGLSLIELMISITIGLLILTGVASVFVNTSAARNEVERTSRQIENGRYAVEVIADDLRLAGYYGELNVGSLAAPTAMPIDQCSLAAADWNAWIPLHVQGYDNGAGFNKITTAACALADQKANTDILLIRRARTCLAGVAGCEAVVAGKPYLQVSLCAEDVTTQHRLDLSTGTFDLRKKPVSPATVCTVAADKREYLVHIYYIGTNNGSGVNVPTLKRLELGLAGGALTWVTTALVEGIEEFNVSYGLDTNGDGAPDSYSALPTGANAAALVAAWQSVVSVQLHVLARNLETSPGYIDAKTYTIGIDSAGNPLTVTTGDGYRRHIYTSLVRLNNPAGRKDTP